MRFSAALLVALACSGAFASQPGQPVDCSDWQILQPGFSCAVVDPGDCYNTDRCSRGSSSMGTTNEGYLLWVRVVPAQGPFTEEQTELVTRQNGADVVIARLPFRRTPLGIQQQSYPANDSVVFDDKRGAAIIPIEEACSPEGEDCLIRRRRSIFAIEGFATTFDVLQTYTPQATLGFRVPYMPEGMGGADHFDTYWGNLTKPIDFTQAHPLACDYPAAPPQVGDYLEVADTVPTPAPGQGVYYVTSATYQGATRYGRKTTAGHLSGRDPAVLPVCSKP